MTTKWSAFTAGAALAGTDNIVGLQGGANVKWTVNQAATFMWASPSLVTPSLGVATATSLAIGATIGTNALAVTGTSALSGQVTNALGTITTSAPFTLTQTWNAGGVTFDAAVTNVTFTAGANPSYLWRGQVAGSDRFQFKVPTASGNGEMVVLSGTSGRTTSLYAGGFSVTESSTATQKVIVEAAGNYVAMSSNTVATWFNNVAIGSGSQDTTLSRNAAGVVQFGTTSANAAGSLLATTGTFSTSVIAPLLQAGGTTSSFPAIKRSTTVLQFKLADDSDFTSFTATTGILNALTSDAGQTDVTVCADSTTGQLYKGSGTLGICLGTSSARYKNRISDNHAGLAQLIQLQPKRFFYKKGYGDDGAREQVGFLAEDAIHVLPNLVGLDKHGQPNSFDLVGTLPIVIKAIQEQQAQLADKEQLLAIAIQAIQEQQTQIDELKKWMH